MVAQVQMVVRVQRKPVEVTVEVSEMQSVTWLFCLEDLCQVVVVWVSM